MASADWDPFQETLPFPEVVARLLERSAVRPSDFSRRLAGGSVPSIDIWAEDDTYVVEAELPGLQLETVSVSVLGRQVFIRGEYPAPPAGRRYLLRERRVGCLERTVTLPADFDADGVEAHYRDGLLRLVVSTAGAARPQRIHIASGPALRTDLPPAVEPRL